MKQKRRFFSLIWDLAAPLLLYMVISDMTLYACRMLGREITEAQILPVNAAGAALAAIPLGIWYREQRQRRHRSGVLQSGTVILLAAGACVFFNNLLMMLDIPSEGFGRARQVLAGPSLPVQILCTGLMIPFAEELVFRGLVYERLRGELPVWGAVLASSVYFGMFHGNLIQGIYAVILGCMMAVLYEWYDSLAAAWLFHAAANLTSVFMTGLGAHQFLAEHKIWNTAVTVTGGILILISAYKIKKGKITT